VEHLWNILRIAREPECWERQVGDKTEQLLPFVIRVDKGLSEPNLQSETWLILGITVLTWSHSSQLIKHG
jgi:hypothetical protein